MTNEQRNELYGACGKFYRDETTSKSIVELVDAMLAAEREACARICERRAEERFNEHGTRESDTNATYYRNGSLADRYEAQDEEDEDCAAAIRARKKP